MKPCSEQNVDLLPNKSGAGPVVAAEHQHHADSSRGEGYHQWKVQGHGQRERRLRRCKAGVSITPNGERQPLVLQRDDVRLFAMMSQKQAPERCVAAVSDHTLESLRRANKFAFAHESRADSAERKAAFLGARTPVLQWRAAARQAPARDRVRFGRRGSATARGRS